MSKQLDKRDFQSAEVLIELGLKFALKGQLEKALALFNAAIELDHSRWEAYRLRGIAYAKLGQNVLALENFIQ